MQTKTEKHNDTEEVFYECQCSDNMGATTLVSDASMISRGVNAAKSASVLCACFQPYMKCAYFRKNNCAVSTVPIEVISPEEEPSPMAK